MKAKVFDFLCSALMNSRTFLRWWWGVFFSVVVMVVSVLVGGIFFCLVFFLKKLNFLNNLKSPNQMYVRVSEGVSELGTVCL